MFADAVIRLYREETFWSHIREGALKRLAEDCAPDRFDAAVAAVLEGARQ
ncbi:hypothetical protein [Acetobacter aceti]|nr:hypothetical protein [Acetobacter aceti]